MSTGIKSKRLNGVDTLRALAAILVVLGHDMHFINKLPEAYGGGITIPLFGGGLGAILLLFISGFMSVYIGWDKFGRAGEAKDYLLKRAARLVPFYWFFTALWLCVAFIAPNVVSQSMPKLSEIVQSFLFIPYARDGGGIFPVLALGWTMNYIFLFDIITALVFRFQREWAVAAICAIVVALLLIHTIGIESAALYFWTGRYLILYAAGAIVAFLYKRFYQKPNSPKIGPLLSLAMLIGLTLFASRYLHGPFSLELTFNFVHLFPIVLAMGIVALLTFESKENPFLRLRDEIAAMSYSIYLTHPFSLGIAILIWSKAALYQYLPIQALFFGALIGSLIIAYVVHILIETPVNRVAAKLITRSKREQQVLVEGSSL